MESELTTTDKLAALRKLAEQPRTPGWDQKAVRLIIKSLYTRGGDDKGEAIERFLDQAILSLEKEAN
jgi:hypothetical protein